MAECRICFIPTNEKLITPCLCKGTIKHIHATCLKKWLKEKYPLELRALLGCSKRSRTNIFCELCNYEFKLNSRYLKPIEIIRKLQSLGLTYSFLLNLPVILYLIYKSSNLLRHLFLFIYSLTLKFNKPKDLIGKILHSLHVYSEFITRALPILISGIFLPIFVHSTWTSLRQLWLECKDLQIENLGN